VLKRKQYLINIEGKVRENKKRLPPSKRILQESRDGRVPRRQTPATHKNPGGEKQKGEKRDIRADKESTKPSGISNS